MSIRHWKDAEFIGADALKKHFERARDHWLWIGYCHFWLLGPGAKNLIRTELHDQQERRVAERERVRHGWNDTTVMSAYAWARSQDTSGKLKLGPCPPTVERDWPDRFTLADSGEGAALVAKAIGAVVTAARPAVARKPAGPTVEVIYDGDGSGAIPERPGRSSADGYQPERADPDLPDPDAHYVGDGPDEELENPFPDDEPALT